MQDILGRELHDNDIVVIKGNTKRDMEVGVFVGKSVRTMNGARVTQNMFLVENPGKKELDIKKDVLDKLAKEQAASKAKRAEKNLNVADEVGRVYQMSRDDEVFLYCGKRLITEYKDGKMVSQANGHFYLTGGRFIRSSGTIAAMNFDSFCKETERRLLYFHPVKPQRSPKKYESTHHQISIPDKFELQSVWTKYVNGKPQNETRQIVIETIE